MPATAPPSGAADAAVCPRPPTVMSGRTADQRGPLVRDVAVAAAIAAVVAAPWIWQGLVPCEWLGVAAGLVLLPALVLQLLAFLGWRTLWRTLP